MIELASNTLNKLNSTEIRVIEFPQELKEEMQSKVLLDLARVLADSKQVNFTHFSPSFSSIWALSVFI